MTDNADDRSQRNEAPTTASAKLEMITPVATAPRVRRAIRPIPEVNARNKGTQGADRPQPHPVPKATAVATHQTRIPVRFPYRYSVT